MQNAVAFSNNDVIVIAWSYGRRPDGCMGFAIHRIDTTGKETPLPSLAVFPGSTIEKGQTTDTYPVQKFYWKDPYARLVAEKTGSRTFRYKIIPLEGTPGHLTPMTSFPALTTKSVTIGSSFGSGTSAYFNRGLISTQRVSRAFSGHPTKGGLLQQVADPKDALRKSLSGDMVAALTSFVDRAAHSGSIYAALYELQDTELRAKLEGLGKRLHIVLSNSLVTDPKTKKTSDANQPARDALAKTAAVEWNRIMPPNHIGHNKYLVYVNRSGTPKAVLLGSTNWTPTGLCTQTNNTVVIEDERLAKRYLDDWNHLAADTKAADGDPKQLQAAPLRTWDATGKTFSLPGKVRVQSWFSPNTPAARKKKTTGEQRPVDMSTVADLIGKAKHAVLFLAFYPGNPCVANWAADAQKQNKDLFVRGCVTNMSAAEGFYYELRGITPPAKVKGQKTPPKEDPRVLAAEAFDGTVVPEGWRKEILNAGFAIIHDKIVVIDPFSDDCVVVTGSHNLGHKASYDNDENLIIVQGNRKLAVAYATHVLDVYDHFSWRWTVKREGKKANTKLQPKPDDWLDRYFDAAGTIKVAQLRFWMSAAV